MLLIVFALGTLFMDQASKALVRQQMATGESIPLVSGIFHLTHVNNSGGAFGILPNQRYLFLVVAFAVILGVALYYHFVRPTEKLVEVAMGLEIGGVVGNVVDRIARGRVTDFLDFRIWPVFNVADSAIFLGLVALGYVTVRGYFREKEIRAREAQQSCD